MRTIRLNFGNSAIALALSIAAMPGLVNGQPQSSTSVNQDGASSKSELKDSVKDTKAGVVLTVHIQPKASTTECVGFHGDAIKQTIRIHGDIH